jgi:hypothetical protein
MLPDAGNGYPYSASGTAATPKSQRLFDRFPL